MSLSDFATHVERFVRNKTQGTRYLYQRVLVRLELFMRTRGAAVGELTDDLAEAWINGMDSVSKNTRRLYWRIMSSFATFLRRIGILSVDPCAAGAPVAAEAPKSRYLEKKDIEAILETARRESARAYVICVVLYNGGFRRDECRTIGIDCVEEAHDGRVKITVTGKGNRRRTVTFGKDASLVIRQWQRVQQRRGRKWLFPGVSGKDALSLSTIHRIVKRVCKAAGFPGASAHFFRHSMASHSLHNGATVNDVREALGHKSLNTTSLYCHATKTACVGDFL